MGEVKFSSTLSVALVVITAFMACASENNGPPGNGNDGGNGGGSNGGAAGAFKDGGLGTGGTGATGGKDGGSGAAGAGSGGRGGSGAAGATGGGAGSSGTGGTGMGGSGAGGNSGAGGGVGGLDGGNADASRDSGAPPDVNDGGPTPAADLTCPHGTVRGTDVISDFSTPTAVMYKTATRGGTGWYGYGPSATDPSVPGSGANAFLIDPANVGPCNAGGSLHFSSPGNGSWGAGIGVNFKPDLAGNKKDIYDATADGATGVGFYLKCSQDVEFLLFKLTDAANDTDVPMPTCSYSTAPLCNQYGIKNAVGLKNWTYFTVYFSETLRDWEPNVDGPGLDAKKLTALQIQVNSKYLKDGVTRAINPFDCWIDDVHFLKTPAPAPPPPDNVTQVGTHTIARGGFYTEGNKIYNSSGAVHTFKGLARPSFEWDAAGFGITREDIHRMKSWGANVVRFSLNQAFWLNTSAQFNKIGYKKYVARAVNWVLSEGMAVILDLHWIDPMQRQAAMPNADSSAFWQDVAKTYKDDGRVVFELYNEPYPMNWATWRSGMQTLYDAVRAQGANNLVLIGGDNYAYDLSGVAANPINNAVNAAFVTHPYVFKQSEKSFQDAFLTPAKTLPVVATEFGNAGINGGTVGCNPADYSGPLSQFQSAGMGWTGWAWIVDPSGCSFPSLLTSYDGTANSIGQVVNDAMP